MLARDSPAVGVGRRVMGLGRRLCRVGAAVTADNLPRRAARARALPVTPAGGANPSPGSRPASSTGNFSDRIERLILSAPVLILAHLIALAALLARAGVV